MERLLALSACLGMVASADVENTGLSTRQTDGAISDTYFLRRAYHSSAVLGDRVYIDGGVFSYSGSDGVQYQYSSTLLYVDLSANFTPATAAISSLTKPAGAPNSVYAGIWTNNGQLYTGFAGREPTFGDKAYQDQGLWAFTPSDNSGDGSWTNLNATADVFFTSNLRPYVGSVASGNGTGWFLGGNVDVSADNTYVPISGLVAYDFATHTVTNTSAAGAASMGGYSSYGQMHYVPTFGAGGVLVSAGGLHDDPSASDSTALASLETVQVFDAASGSWFDQATTGTAPPSRKEFCMTGAASTNDTYEIVVYAGWNGTLGDAAIAWDALYVLSLPAFHWFQASYEALHPRHGLTCEHVGGGQVLVIGGVDSTQTYAPNYYEGTFQTGDTHAQGLAVFDLATMAWAAGGFESGRSGAYELAPMVASWYEGNERMADFTNEALKSVFSVQNFTAAATASGSAEAGNSTSSSSPAASSSQASLAAGAKSSTSTGAIAGGVIGGIAAVALVGAAALFAMRRRKRSRLLNETHNDDRRHVFTGPPHGEMPGYPMEYNRPELASEKMGPSGSVSPDSAPSPAQRGGHYAPRSQKAGRELEAVVPTELP